MKLTGILKELLSEADEDMKRIKYKVVASNGSESGQHHIAYFSDKDQAEWYYARYSDQFDNCYFFQKAGSNWQPIEVD